MSIDIEVNTKFIELLRKKTKKAALSIAREFAVTSVKHFKEGFQIGGGQTDAGKWQPRKNNADPERAILVKTGSLQRAIKIKSVSTKSVVIGTDASVPYAERINFGDEIMPAREFIGRSEWLTARLKRLAARILEKELKKK